MSAEPKVVWLPGDVRSEVHLSGEDTEGAFCLIVDHPPAGWLLPPHRHLHEAETIHVVAGRFSMEVDGVKSVLEPGDTVHVPIGAVHSGGNVGLETGTRVVIFSPAGLERLFLEIGAAAPGTPADAPALVAAAGAYGFVFVQ